MSELAFNVNGDSFEVPPSVVAWRVRRMKPRGAPELVYGRDGRPLQIGVEADIDELREAVETLGRYRLDPLTEDGKIAEGVPAAYVQVVATRDGGGGPTTPAVRESGDGDSLAREAIRANAEIAKAVIERFPAMMDAAARLVEAADGAGIAARRPAITPPQVDAGHADAADDASDDAEADDAEADDAPTAGFDLNALVAQVMPVVVGKLMNGGLDLAAMLDWRKAKPAGDGAPMHKARRAPNISDAPVDASAREVSTPASTPPDKPPTNHATPALTAAQMVHFLAIQNALGERDAAMARAIAAELSPDERSAWLAELAALPVPDAVAKIRAVLAGDGKGAA